MTAMPFSGWNHNDDCVGCGAHIGVRCHPSCPMETGDITVSTLLRAAAHQLYRVRAAQGARIDFALTVTADDLIDPDAAPALCAAAESAVTDYLARAGSEGVNGEYVLYLYGLSNPLPEIARTLYATAAHIDGIEFDADAFGEYPA